MRVPLLDLKAQHGSIREEILCAVTRVLDSNRFVLGPEVETLEKRVAEYCHTKYAIGVSSGTDALLVALMASGIGQGDEVVTTTYSFFATAGVIARVGAKPVFVDIDSRSYNIDPRHIEQAISPRSKAIMPVHLFGQCADMEPVLKLAEEYQLKVIEDAAQAIGAKYRDGRRTGSMGDIGCLSFFPSKNLGALGDGGMVVTNDPDLAEAIRLLRTHGAKPKYYHKTIGGNFRLDAVQAAVLNVKFEHLDGWTNDRQQNAARYESLFQASGLVDANLVCLPEAVYQHDGVDHHHVYNQYVIRVPERDGLRQHLNQKGIDTAIYYPVPFHLQECFQALGHRRGDLPEAEQAANETLTLPIYPEVTTKQQQWVVKTIEEFYMKRE